MKNLLCIIAVGTLLTGCFTENNKAVAKLNEQMSPEWLKAHVVAGKTTPQEIQGFFGVPLIKNSSSGSGLGAAFMPDEMWTYSVRFAQAEAGFNPHVYHWSKAIVFSFKNGTVSNYNVSSTSF